MTKALFINPIVREESSPKHAPYGLGILAQIAMDMSWQVAFYDANGLRLDSVEENRYDYLQQILDADTWDTILIGGITTAYRYIKATVQRARKHHPDVLIVGGGGCFTSLPREVMTWLPEVNIACIGEGFETIKDILNHAQNREWDNVKGIIWRDEYGELHINQLRPLIPNLETLPLPAYNLLPMETYFENSGILMSEEAMQSRKRIDLLFSFGCSLACRFCFHEGIAGDLKLVTSGSQLDVAFDNAGVTRIHRWVSPEHAIWMIKEANRKLRNVPPEGDIDFVAWLDENIVTMHWASPSKNWVYKLSNAFIDVGFPEWIHHGGTSHASLIKPEILRAFAQMGFTYLDYGLEHSHPLILKEIGKGSTRENNGRAIRWTIDAGMRPIPNMIIGHPSESFETLYDLLAFWEEYGVFSYPFFATAYPGCQWYYDYKPEILRQYNWNLEAYVEDLGDATKPTASISRNFTAIELIGIREVLVQRNRRLLNLYEENWKKTRGIEVYA